MIALFAAAASAAALLHSTMVTGAPLIADDATPGPMPQNGIWALLPAECDTPTDLDLSAWPKCATPIGFADDEVAALEKPAPGNKATTTEFYSIGRTRYAVAPASGADAPAVVQVAVPQVFSRSYYYLAVTPAAPLDASGRFAAATGWPIACLPKAQGGCRPKTLADVQAQAAIAPDDPKRLWRMVRITAPGAVDTATGDAAATAAPPAPGTPTPAAPAAPGAPATTPPANPTATPPAMGTPSTTPAAPASPPSDNLPASGPS